MAKPEDFQLAHTATGLPYLKGEGDPRNLPAGAARKRLDELLQAQASTPRAPLPKGRPLAPPFQPPKPEPVKAPTNARKLAGIGGAVGQWAAMASAGLGPSGLIAKKLTPAAPYEPPTVSEAEMERGLAAGKHQRDIQRAEDLKKGIDYRDIEREDPTSKEFQYYNFQKKRPPNWSPTPGDLTDLVTQGYLPAQYSNDPEEQWAAFRERAMEPLRIPARYAALQAESREKLLPGEKEVRDAYFKKGMNFTEAGANIDWHRDLETLQNEWWFVLDSKRVKAGKPSIKIVADQEEVERFREEVLEKSIKTLSSIAAATGFSISDVSDPERMKNIEWYWAAFEPFRASLSPVTIYNPNPQAVSGDAAEALFALGEPTFVPAAQEAYGNLGKFARAASVILTPLSGMLESGENWHHEDTLKKIISGGGDPFDHLQEWGELFGQGKKLGVAVLTIGLLLEPEPFTTILALPAAGRKALTYATKKGALKGTEDAIEAALKTEKANSRISPAELLEEIKKTEPATANFLGVTSQQSIGIKGRSAPALSWFDLQLREVENTVEKLQKEILDLSKEGRGATDAAKSAEAERVLASKLHEKAILEEGLAISQRDAALSLRGVPEGKKFKDTKKKSGEDWVEGVLKKQAKTLEAEVKKRAAHAKTTGKALEREDVRIGGKLRDILGREAPLVARTARGGVRKDWYPLFEVPPGAKAPQLSRTLERVQWKDVAAVKVDGKWVKSTKKGGVIGGPGAELRIADISVGRANQVTKNSPDISLPKSPRKGETFELWIDVFSANGKEAYRVRHPISRSSWAARPDAKKLLEEGFGINASQAEDLRQALQIRRGKADAAAGPGAAYALAVANRKANAVLYEETVNAVTAERLIEKVRKATAKKKATKKLLVEAQKGAKTAGKTGKGATKDLTKLLEKEAKVQADIGARKLARGTLKRQMEKVLHGTKGLRALLKERTGGMIGAAFKRGLNDILNYKQLRPDELEKMVADATVKTITPITKLDELFPAMVDHPPQGFVSGGKITDVDYRKYRKKTKGLSLDSGAAVVNSSQYKQALLSAHLKAPGATRETAEEAIELLKARNPIAKRVLDAAEEGKKVQLTGSEVAQWQEATREFFHATWRDRVSSGPLAYASALEREKEYRIFWGPRNWRNAFPRHFLKESKLPEVAARLAKTRSLGVTDGEVADTLIFSSNVYDVGINELIAVTHGGALGEEAAKRAVTELMDNKAKVALKSDLAGSVQYQEFERVLGADSRFVSAKAALLEDFRVAPRRELTPAKMQKKKEEFAKLRDTDPDLIEDDEVYKALGMEEGEAPVPLQGMAYAFYPSGVGSTGKGRALERAALRILRGVENKEGVFEGGARTFQEFTDRMIIATNEIIGAPADTSTRAYTMAATAATGAAVMGYSKNLLSKLSYAPITSRQALAANRLLAQNPDIAVNITEKGWKKAAFSEKEIEEGIEALNKLGLPLGERGVRLFSKEKIIPRVKELVRITKEGSANPYTVRALLNEIDSFSGGAVKQLEATAARARPLEGVPHKVYDATAGAYLGLSSMWRTSVTTGLFLPNPGYWTNNIIGDLSQMWLQEGLWTASVLSFNNVANNIPYWGRGLADRQLAMQAWAAKQGKDALISPLEAFMNPYLGKLLKGDDFTMVSKTGMRIEASSLVREAIEDGIYSTQVNQELYNLYKTALKESNGWKAFQDLGRGQNKKIADHANIVQQRQRMGLYAHYRIDKGLSRAEARSRTLEALYDWKDGVSAAELNVFVKISPFYRFWKLGMRQMAGAFLDPVTRPVLSQLKKSLVGQTKMARMKQQIMLFGGMPEIFGYEDMVEGNRDAALLDAFYSHKFPEWMETRILTGFYGMPTDKGYRDWYMDQYGRDYDSMARVAPTATILDTAGLAFNLMETAYGVSQMMGADKVPGLPKGTVPTNWASKATEPWLQQTNPAVQTALRGLLDHMGIPTEYGAADGQMKLRMGEEEVLLSADAALGLFGLGLGIGDRDPKTGAYKMSTWTYHMAQLFPGLLTQTPRWVKAMKNPGWNESYREGALWFVQSITRLGARTPYSGKREYDKSVRRFEEGWDKRETKGYATQDTSGRNPLE